MCHNQTPTNGREVGGHRIGQADLEDFYMSDNLGGTWSAHGSNSPAGKVTVDARMDGQRDLRSLKRSIHSGELLLGTFEICYFVLLSTPSEVFLKRLKASPRREVGDIVVYGGKLFACGAAGIWYYVKQTDTWTSVDTSDTYTGAAVFANQVSQGAREGPFAGRGTVFGRVAARKDAVSAEKKGIV